MTCTFKKLFDRNPLKVSVAIKKIFEVFGLKTARIGENKVHIH